MFSYFVDKYLNPDWGAIVTAILSAISLYFLCFKPVKKKDIPKEIFRFLLYWVVWVLLSALFYAAFPESNIGFAVLPLVFSIFYVIIDKRISLWERIVRTSVFITISIYSSAISLPINFIDSDVSPDSFPFLSLLFRTFLFGGTIYLLQRFSLERFRFSVYFFTLIEAVCVIGYAMNLVSIFIGIDSQFQTPFSSNFFTSISLTAIELLVYIMFYMLNDEADKKEKHSLEEMRMKNELKMMSMYEIGYNKVRAVRHEIYDQYSYVNVMLKNKQYKEAGDYFDQLHVYVTDMQNIYTDNHIANIALNLAFEQAEEAGIKTDFKVAIPKALSLPDTEFVSLLNNLISNAIEACNRIKDNTEKFLKVSLSYENGHLLIYVINSCDSKKVRSVDGLPKTTKKNKSMHGIGLNVVQQIVENHSGYFDWKVENSVFTARALVRCDIVDQKEEKKDE